MLVSEEIIGIDKMKSTWVYENQLKFQKLFRISWSLYLLLKSQYVLFCSNTSINHLTFCIKSMLITQSSKLAMQSLWESVLMYGIVFGVFKKGTVNYLKYKCFNQLLAGCNQEGAIYLKD